MLLSGLHCSTPVQNGVSSSSLHPKGSYPPLPHIYLGNGSGGPSWPSNVPLYSQLPGGCGIKRPVRDQQVQGEPNGSAALIGRNSKGNSADKDCRNWVEKTNQAMQGSRGAARSEFRLRQSPNSSLFSPQPFLLTSTHRLSSSFRLTRLPPHPTTPIPSHPLSPLSLVM